MHLNIKKSNLFIKWAEDLNRYFPMKTANSYFSYVFLRKHTDCQQSDENMLNITNHQENKNQNHNEIISYSLEWQLSKSLQITSATGNSYAVGRNVKVYNSFGKQCGDSSPKKLKIELPCDPGISLLGVYSKTMKTLTWGIP